MPEEIRCPWCNSLLIPKVVKVGRDPYIGRKKYLGTMVCYNCNAKGPDVFEDTKRAAEAEAFKETARCIPPVKQETKEAN